ncbi:MAG: hypothetical protein ABJF01_19645 [bacterium]
MITSLGYVRSPAVAIALAACLGACARSRHAEGATDPAPRIDAVRPDSVVVPRGSVVEVMIVGRGFAPGTPGANTIELAGTSITQVPANPSGTEMKFVIPETVASRGGAAPLPLESGTYALRITTTAGTSNPMTIRIYR